MMRSLALLFALALTLSASSPVLADVYPFEEDYSDAPPVDTGFRAEVVAQETETPFVTKQSVVTREAREYEQQRIADEIERDDFYRYNKITFKNFGSIMVNLARGVGDIYKGLFTEAFPAYGSDLASYPAVTAELTGRFVEIERQYLFEQDAKQKEIDAYIEAQQAPLTPKEQELLEDFRGKPISTK